tara:strand:+ start:3421 stop:3882 length:462 start_codon:yes stop_codon:yes gene_type:complete
MNNNKNDNYLKIDKIIDVLKEHSDKNKAYNRYIKKLSTMALAALNDENVLASTKIEFRVKKKIATKRINNNPRDLLDLLTSSGTPDEFARNLDSIQGKIEENRQNEKEWEELFVKLDDLDNEAFITLLSRIIEVVKEFKSKLDIKAKKICERM